MPRFFWSSLSRSNYSYYRWHGWIRRVSLHINGILFTALGPYCAGTRLTWRWMRWPPGVKHAEFGFIQSIRLSRGASSADLGVEHDRNRAHGSSGKTGSFEDDGVLRRLNTHVTERFGIGHATIQAWPRENLSNADWRDGCGPLKKRSLRRRNAGSERLRTSGLLRLLMETDVSRHRLGKHKAQNNRFSHPKRMVFCALCPQSIPRKI